MPLKESMKSSSKPSSKKSASLIPKAARSSKRKTVIVGIVGKAGAGKSTLAYSLQDALHVQKLASSVYSLARPVKEIANILLQEVDYKSIDKEKLYKIGSRQMSGRTVLQLIGTEFGRYLDPDIWIEYLLRTINNDKMHIALVDDVRFLNEFEEMDIRIGIIDAAHKPSDFSSHSSETEMDGLLMADKLDLLLVRKGDTYYPVVDGKQKKVAISVEEIAEMIRKVKL